MSWAEVKKINSDFSTPINIANLINHIDLVGNTFIGYSDNNLSLELVLSDALYSHQIASEVIGIDSLSTQEKIDLYGYIWLCKMVGIDYSSYTNITDLLSNTSYFSTMIVNPSIVNAIIRSDICMNIISKNNTLLGIISNSISGTTTVSWENNTVWQILYDTMDNSPLFTNSGLLSDTGGTKVRTGNLITLISSASFSIYKGSITPAKIGCFSVGYAGSFSTGKHIMFGGHTSVHETTQASSCVVKHYMFTPI